MEKKKKVSNPKFLTQERAARWGVQSEGAGGFTLTETMEQIIWIDKTQNAFCQWKTIIYFFFLKDYFVVRCKTLSVQPTMF